MVKKEGTTTAWEKIAYALGDGGFNFVWTFASSFLTLYYTDSVLISAAFVGTMMLVCRIFDGVSDIAMGFVIEKTNTRFGKARPWFGGSIIPLVISFFLVYNVPASLDGAAKLTYVVITYFMLTVVMATINNLSYHAMLSRISLDQNDRDKISSLRGIFAFLIGLVLAVATTKLLGAFGGENNQRAWTMTAAIYAATCLLMQGISFFCTKEKITDTAGSQAKEEKTSPLAALKALLKTRYFYISVLVFIFSYIMSGSFFGVAIFYARDVLGNAGYYAQLAVCYVIPMVIGMAIVPKFLARFGKRRVLVFGALLSAVGAVVGLMNARNLPVVMGALVLKALGTAPYSSAMFTFAPDIVNYMEGKIGMRIEGLATSANSFGIKLGTGLGSALIGWGLAIGRYNPALAVQPASAQTAQIMLLFGIPIVLDILRAVAMCFWDMDEQPAR